MSGGVIIAETLNTITIAKFSISFKKIWSNKSYSSQEKIKIGNSKINPEDKTEALNKPI